MTANTAYESTPAVAGIVTGYRRWAEARRAAADRRQAYRATRAELSALTDRELNDIGISRAAIDDIAREAAATA